MERRKDGLFVLIIGFCVVLVGVGLFFVQRSEKRKDFEALLKSDMYLEADLGIIPRKRVLMEKNALLKKMNKENESFLYITKKNVLFTFYYDWYYLIDPLQGVHKDYQETLSSETVQKILDAVNEKAIDDLTYKIEDDYARITIDGKLRYIEKIQLQYIMQDNDLDLPVYSVDTEEEEVTNKITGKKEKKKTYQ